MTRRTTAAGAVLTALALAGCNGGGTSSTTAGPSASTARTATIPPAASPTASTSSEQDQAYAAAVTAYKSFVQTLDQVERDGGKHPERFDRVAVGLALAQARAIAEGFRVSERHTVGKTVLAYVRPGRFVPATTASGKARVQIKSCEEPGGAYAVDRSGKRIALKHAPTAVAYTIDVEGPGGSGGAPWLVSGLRTDLVKSCS
jgi:hypothetical protein